jgi:hypothetical protein
LVKTFVGWAEHQLPDGTLILTSPAGQAYVTTPGSALRFPRLCSATGAIAAPEVDPPPDDGGQRTAMMPLRTTTRAQNHATRIATERQHNQLAREARQKHWERCYPAPDEAVGDGEPPPF